MCHKSVIILVLLKVWLCVSQYLIVSYCEIGHSLLPMKSRKDCTGPEDFKSSLGTFVAIAPARASKAELIPLEEVHVIVSHLHHFCRLDEDEAEAVLRPEWQINPLDIYFCSKKNNKLLKLGKGGFGTVCIHMSAK